MLLYIYGCRALGLYRLYTESINWYWKSRIKEGRESDISRYGHFGDRFEVLVGSETEFN